MEASDGHFRASREAQFLSRPCRWRPPCGENDLAELCGWCALRLLRTGDVLVQDPAFQRLFDRLEQVGCDENLLARTRDLELQSALLQEQVSEQRTQLAAKAAEVGSLRDRVADLQDQVQSHADKLATLVGDVAMLSLGCWQQMGGSLPAIPGEGEGQVQQEAPAGDGRG